MTEDKEREIVLDVKQTIKSYADPLNRPLLVAAIACLMSNIALDVAKHTTAACMGMKEDDPSFITFYNKDIQPILDSMYDVNVMRRNLERWLEEEENKDE